MHSHRHLTALQTVGYKEWFVLKESVQNLLPSKKKTTYPQLCQRAMDLVEALKLNFINMNLTRSHNSS